MRNQRVILTAALFLSLAFAAVAGDDRAPRVRGAALNIQLVTSVGVNDTYVFSINETGRDGRDLEIPSFLVGITADTDMRFLTKGDTAAGNGWPIWANQYWPDVMSFKNGDTLVAKCQQCVGSSIGRMFLRIYRGGEAR